jgi:Zn2+/Cd2+-exporting ATPase
MIPSTEPILEENSVKGKTLQIDLPLLLPTIDPNDSCIPLLTGQLKTIKGIQEVHIIQDNGMAWLCLHYDPNLLTLNRVERLAREAGAAITDRYRHEQIPIAWLNVADAADTVTGY